MSGRGHRKLRLCSRKNYEKKKYEKRPLVISIPCSQVACLSAQPLEVSLPISVYEDAPITSLYMLQTRLNHMKISGNLVQSEHYSLLLHTFRVETSMAEWYIITVPTEFNRVSP